MRETTTKGLFWRWGNAVYRLRWAILAIWVIVFISFAFFAQKAPELLKDNGFTPIGSDSDKGLSLLRKELNVPASIINLVYTSDKLDLTSQAQRDRLMSSLAQVKALPYVVSVSFNSAARLNGDKSLQSIIVATKLETNAALDAFPSFKEMISAPEGIDVHISGPTAVLNDMQEASKNDIAKSEAIGLPIAIIVLLLVFGTILGALLPMIVGIMSVTVTLGIVYFIALHYANSNFLPNIVTMLGLAVGIDYALFMVSRFREELKKQPNIQEAVAMTCQMSGRSIFFSGIAVLIGLAGMMFINLNIFHSLCLGGVLVVFISVLVANTLLLALLGIFGHRINSLKVIPASWTKNGTTAFWHRIAYAVMKRPLVLILAMSALLVYLMIPVGNIQLGIPDAEVLPPSYQSRFGSDLMKLHYDNREMNPIQIAVQTKGVGASEAVKSQLNDYVAQIKALPLVKSAIIAQIKQNISMIVVIPELDPNDNKVNGLVENIRSLPANSELQILVTGGPAFRVDILDRISKGIPYVIIFVMGVTYLVLLVAFRSILLPLKAVLMNVLSLGASLGIVVSVFQNGHLAGLFHITYIGDITATLPVIIFCVVFGISMDYEVFLISRIAEEYEATGNNELSTAEGLKKTGGLITSAALILIVVVGSFIFTDILIIKALGLGLATAVLIDATLIRIVIVPALMKLLGKANWWAPKWLKNRGERTKWQSES